MPTVPNQCLQGFRAFSKAYRYGCWHGWSRAALTNLPPCPRPLSLSPVPRGAGDLNRAKPCQTVPNRAKPCQPCQPNVSKAFVRFRIRTGTDAGTVRIKMQAPAPTATLLTLRLHVVICSWAIRHRSWTGLPSEAMANSFAATARTPVGKTSPRATSPRALWPPPASGAAALAVERFCAVIRLGLRRPVWFRWARWSPG